MFKVCFVLLLASVSISLTYALDICEYQLNGTRLAHPGDCNKFVVCNNGRTQNIRHCPIGLHFNRFKGVCDLREQAACDFELVQLADIEVDCSACCTVCGCDSTSTPETPENTGTPTPEIPEGPCTPTPETPENPDASTPEIPEGSNTPTPETPEGPGSPTPEIPEGPGTPTPEIPEGPGSPTPETPKGPVTPTPEIPNCSYNSIVCIGKPNGSVSHVNGTCNQYIVCVGGCANIVSCPDNLQYSLTTNQCDHPQNVNCPWQPKPPNTGPSGVACAQPSKCAGKPDGILLSDPKSNGYIVCQCECEIERPCPAGTKFNETLQVCGHINNDSDENNGGNDNGNNGGNGNGNDGANGNGNDGGNDNGNNGGNDNGNNEGNDNGNNEGNGNGNNEGNGNGNNGGNGNGNNEGNGNGNNGGNGNENSNSNQTICTNKITVCQNQTSGSQLPVEGICNKFYVCNYDCAVEILCPSNLIYNPNKKYCDYPKNYKCPWPYTPPSGTNAGPSGIACASGGRCVGKADGTFFPSNGNHTKYVICQCECEVELDCPAGLIWDNKLLSCNYPANNVEKINFNF